MAKVISTLFISADGVAEIDPDWHFPYFDDNMGGAVDEDYRAADVLLIGRVTYSELLQGDLADAVTALKAEPGIEGIVIPGSISVVQQLLAAGLVDELRLLVHPVAARKGRRLFDDGDTPYHLELVKTEAYPTGVVRLIYTPAPAPGQVTYDEIKDHVPDGDE